MRANSPTSNDNKLREKAGYAALIKLFHSHFSRQIMSITLRKNSGNSKFCVELLNILCQVGGKPALQTDQSVKKSSIDPSLQI